VGSEVRQGSGIGAGRSGNSPVHAATIALAMFAAWLVPGLGHWLLGRRGKGLLYFGIITFTFVAGMWLADWRNVRSDDDFQLYLIGEAFCGGLTLVAWKLTQHLELLHPQPWLDAGLLFSTVAGIMNVCVIVDVYETARPRPQPGESVREGASA